MNTVPLTEVARRICLANHDARLAVNVMDRNVPCPKHVREAQDVYGLTQPYNEKTLGILLEVASDNGVKLPIREVVSSEEVGERLEGEAENE